MTKDLSRVFTLAFAAILTTLAFTASAFAQFTITDLHNFGSTGDGIDPEVAPVMDSAGNLFGVTPLGGAHGDGVAYELSPSSTGWTYTNLYDFAGGTTGANLPNGSLIFDASGNLYGVSQFAGANNKGTVYELSPSSSGWTLTVLYSFAGGTTDGQAPSGSLLFDTAGNLYGTTTQGGANGSGTVFELSPSSSGWTEQVIYSFTGGADGANPSGNLLIDSAGRIYGTATLGGTIVSQACPFGCGTIFRLTNASGTWRFARLFNFQGKTGGSAPLAIAFDSAGNIYGSANAGGSGCTTNLGCGTIFKLTPPASGGPWKEKVLHAFNGQEGEYPTGVAFDSKGNLYGTCFGGASQNEGNVWELTPTTSGPWTFTSLFVFGKASDGYEPNSGVIVDSKGNLYGTNSQGNSGGTVFELSPAAGEEQR